MYSHLVKLYEPKIPTEQYEQSPVPSPLAFVLVEGSMRLQIVAEGACEQTSRLAFSPLHEMPYKD